MAGYLEIISPGFQSTIQDRGRWGFQELGVPISGTVVPHWMELGNNLVGNGPEVAGIEFRAFGPTLRAVDAPVKLAICGDAPVEVVSKSNAGTQVRRLAGWRSFTLNPDEELKVGSLENSISGFVAISGGIDIAPVMASFSTYVRSEFGGLKGRTLDCGDLIPLNETAAKLACDADKVHPSPPAQDGHTVRVVLGPQDDYFDEKAHHDFFTHDFGISKASDRMGARLDGPTIQHKQKLGSEIISDGVAPGAIQVPGNGHPIVLLNDGQTVGGYPKIATVISCDLHKIANALPGTLIRFEAVDVHEACLITRREQDMIERMKKDVVAASANGFVNLKALYETNLIGGVVDMKAPNHFPGHLED